MLEFCTSNERQYLSLYIDVFKNIYKCEKVYTKKENFGIHLSNVHISLDFSLKIVKYLMAVRDIHTEGTVSQNFDLCLSFCFM